MNWFKLTGLGLDIRPNINSQKKDIAPKSPPIQTTKFLACKVGVFCSAKDDSICSSTISDLKTDTELGRVTVCRSSLSFLIAVKMAAAINIPLSSLLKKKPALQSTKICKDQFRRPTRWPPPPRRWWWYRIMMMMMILDELQMELSFDKHLVFADCQYWKWDWTWP